MMICSLCVFVMTGSHSGRFRGKGANGVRVGEAAGEAIPVIPAFSLALSVRLTMWGFTVGLAAMPPDFAVREGVRLRFA